jgi:hypothetical protein
MIVMLHELYVVLDVSLTFELTGLTGRRRLSRYPCRRRDGREPSQTRDVANPARPGRPRALSSSCECQSEAVEVLVHG